MRGVPSSPSNASPTGHTPVLVTRAGMGIRERMASLVGSGGTKHDGPAPAPGTPAHSTTSPSATKVKSPRKWGAGSPRVPASAPVVPSSPISPRTALSPRNSSAGASASASYVKERDCKISIKLPNGAKTLLYMPRGVALDNVKIALWNQSATELVQYHPDDFLLGLEGSGVTFPVEFLKLVRVAPQFVSVMEAEGVVALELYIKPDRLQILSPLKSGGAVHSNADTSVFVSPRMSRPDFGSPAVSRGPLGVRAPVVGFSTPRIGRLAQKTSPRQAVPEKEQQPKVEDTIIGGELQVSWERSGQEIIQMSQNKKFAELSRERQKLEEEKQQASARRIQQQQEREKEEEERRKALHDAEKLREERLRLEEETQKQEKQMQERLASQRQAELDLQHRRAAEEAEARRQIKEEKLRALEQERHLLEEERRRKRSQDVSERNRTEGGKRTVDAIQKEDDQKHAQAKQEELKRVLARQEEEKKLEQARLEEMAERQRAAEKAEAQKLLDDRKKKLAEWKRQEEEEKERLRLAQALQQEAVEQARLAAQAEMMQRAAEERAAELELRRIGEELEQKKAREDAMRLEQEVELKRLAAEEKRAQLEAKRQAVEEQERELLFAKEQHKLALELEEQRRRKQEIQRQEEERQLQLRAMWLQQESEQRERVRREEEARQALLFSEWLSEERREHLAAQTSDAPDGASLASRPPGNSAPVIVVGGLKVGENAALALLAPDTTASAGSTEPGKKSKSGPTKLREHKRTNSWFARLTSGEKPAEKSTSGSGVDALKAAEVTSSSVAPARAGSRLNLAKGTKDSGATPLMSRLSGAKKAVGEAFGMRGSRKGPIEDSGLDEPFIPLSALSDEIDDEDEVATFERIANRAMSLVDVEQARARARSDAYSERTRTIIDVSKQATPLVDSAAQLLQPLKVLECNMYSTEEMVVNLADWTREENFALHCPHSNDKIYALLAEREHSNFCGHDAALGPVVCSVPSLNMESGAVADPCILWTDRGLSPFRLPGEMNMIEEALRLRVLGHILVNQFGVQAATQKLVLASTPEFSSELIQLERSLQSLSYKFGVMYALEGQSQNEMFGNRTHSPAFENFLELLGNRIELLGWSNFRGGLDVKHGHTGTHSVFSQFSMGGDDRELTFDIMFHVSTMLPHSEKDEQQLERKRHLGNDIVVIIFLEGDGSIPFDPSIIKSEFNHVFLLVQPVVGDAGLQYRVATIYKSGVNPCNPFIPFPGFFAHNDAFRRWILAKCVNAERASIECKTFSQKLRRTRKTQLQLLVNREVQAEDAKE